MNTEIIYPEDVSKEQEKLITSFINFLEKELPLENDLTVQFMNKRTGTMTTGSRTNKHRLKIFIKDRLNRDIMRTLAHEWTHEHQRTVLGRNKGRDIGGKNEDEANSKAGELVKKFEKNQKKEMPRIYKTFAEQISRLESMLQVESFKNKEIISEIKKISIDKLPYEFDDLEDFIDSETMKTHYNKHYKGYVDKLNGELEKIKGKDLDLEEIVSGISKFNTKVRNNGGGAFNHALFWKMLTPKKTKLENPLLYKIESTFGSYEKFKEKFEEEAKSRFGSGWVWLVLTKTNRLKIVTTPNQDNPLMMSGKNKSYPLLGLDLWEHAYYLKYKNERDRYIHNYWKVVNWDFVTDLYTTQLERNKAQ